MKSGESNKPYFQRRLATLNEQQRYVTLIIDEIYIASKLEYCGGKFVGFSENSDTLASTVLSFMISSIAGDYRDIVSLFPVRKLNTDFLHEKFLSTMQFIHSIGFRVLIVCVDNYSVNRAFYINKLCNGTLQSSIPNPCDPDSPLYLTFDTTHNVKNIYNNFQSKKVFVCPPFSPQSSSFTANFQHIEELYYLERDKSVKIAHKLRAASLNPTNLQRTSVKHSASVFCESTAQGLSFYAPEINAEWRGTAEFLQTIIKYWSILNVRTPFIGKHKRDLYRDPIRSSADWKLLYLTEFLEFLRKWQFSQQPCLTKQTFTAVAHSTQALIHVVQYLLDRLGFNYVLLGSIQSDPLEERFGWYRQLAGGNYYLSLRQVLEAERKIKTLSLLKFCGLLDCHVAEGDEQPFGNAATVQQIVSSLTFDTAPSYSDACALFYVAGYITKTILHRRECSSCEQLLKSNNSVNHELESDELSENTSDLLTSLNRGGLTYPSDYLFLLCIKCWNVFSEIKQKTNLTKMLLHSSSSRSMFTEIMKLVLENDTEIYFLGCENGHDLLSQISRSMFNIMAKNTVADTNSTSACSSNLRKVIKFNS